MNGEAVIIVLSVASVLVSIRALIDFNESSKEKESINKRLQVRNSVETLADAVGELRHKAGLDEDGNRRIKNEKLWRLVSKSGLPFQPKLWALVSAASSTAVFGLVWYKLSLLFAVIAALAVFFALPYFVLSRLGKTREKKLDVQLPEALDTIVRSLKAGHPVPTAFSLVGREMPDPIGTEFGLAADEIAYGSSLEEATAKMAIRTEHSDMNLFAAVVRLQTRTGGNLAELLASNSRTIRSRQKMRMKVKAASAEGRMSALILTAAPFIVLLVLQLMSPHFYGDVIHEPLIQWTLGLSLVWIIIGNVVLRKMTNFKI